MGGSTHATPNGDDHDPDHAPEPVLVSVETRRPGTRDPHRSRVRALKVLFQADVRGQDPSAAIAGIATNPHAVALLDDLDDDEAGTPGDLDEYARTLVDGVATRQHAIDGIVGRFSHRWEVGRMPVVDRNILRLGVWELLFEDVSAAVVIDEALELAKQHSTDASHRFVNGILEAVRRDADDLRAELDVPGDAIVEDSATMDPDAPTSGPPAAATEQDAPTPEQDAPPSERASTEP